MELLLHFISVVGREWASVWETFVFSYCYIPWCTCFSVNIDMHCLYWSRFGINSSMKCHRYLISTHNTACRPTSPVLLIKSWAE